MNLRIQQVRENIIQIVNNSELPIGCALLIIENIEKELNAIFQQQCLREQEEQLMQLEDEEDDESTILIESDEVELPIESIEELEEV